MQQADPHARGVGVDRDVEQGLLRHAEDLVGHVVGDGPGADGHEVGAGGAPALDPRELLAHGLLEGAAREDAAVGEREGGVVGEQLGEVEVGGGEAAAPGGDDAGADDPRTAADGDGEHARLAGGVDQHRIAARDERLDDAPGHGDALGVRPGEHGPGARGLVDAHDPAVTPGEGAQVIGDASQQRIRRSGPHDRWHRGGGGDDAGQCRYDHRWLPPVLGDSPQDTTPGRQLHCAPDRSPDAYKMHR